MAERKNNSYGFEIPGSSSESIQEQQAGGSEAKEAAANIQEQDVRKYTLFWFLQHYSKENKALYELHKQWKKSEKEKKKAEKKSGSKQTGSTSQSESGSQNGSQDVEKDQDGTKQPADTKDDNYGATVFVNRKKMAIRTPSAETVKLPSAELECPGFDATVPIAKLPFRIGRSHSGVDLCIEDNETVSRIHAEILASEGNYYIRDLDSVNHVYLNDMQIPSESYVLLKDGAKFSLGTEQFVFRIIRNDIRKPL